MIVLFMSRQVVYAQELVDIHHHWAKEQIIDAQLDQMVCGYENGTFQPNRTITLPEFVKMLLTSSKDFLEVEGTVLYPDAYLLTAERRGYITEEEKKEVKKKMTRYDVATILARYLPLEEVEKTSSKLTDLSAYEEQTTSKLVALGVIKGYEDKTFRGNQPVTRAEAVVMIQRATQMKRKLALDKLYPLEKSLAYANYQNHSKKGTLYDDVNFEIQKGSLFVTDEGRYQTVNHQKITSDIFDTSKVIKVIQNLVNETGYVGVVQYPAIDNSYQLAILYGANEKRVSNGAHDFCFIYYQSNGYDLKESSHVDVFSNHCYLKIVISKLWEDYHEFQKGNYVESYLSKRLEKALEGEFGSYQASQIAEYIKEKVNDKFAGQEHDFIEIGQKIFGSYQVDYYRRENELPEFYFSKIN